MKIHLINPGQLDERGRLIRFRKEWHPGLTLPYLAALIPEGHEIRLIEDFVNEIDYEDPVDLVALTAMTSRAPRAYQIADEYRRRGIPVIMGGFHASFMTDEALEHVDSVVVGEADGIMETLLADLEHDKMKMIYRRDSWHDMKNLPVPRYDLIDFNNYILPFYPVQVSRGCPNRCEFCSVTRFFGGRYRYRPIEDVLRDLEQAGPLIIFIDDNITADQDYSYELFKRMKPLKKLWVSQMDMSFPKQERLVRAAGESGCFACYIGLESINAHNLRSMRKPQNRPEEYREAIMTLKHYQIQLFASMIVGFENETSEDFNKLREFFIHAKVPYMCAYILTPLPGTKLHDRYFNPQTDEKPSWSMFDCQHSTFELKSMSRHELEEKYWEMGKWFYSWPSMIRRLTFPAHAFTILFNWLTQKKANHRIHPWQGIPHGLRLGLPGILIRIIVHNRRILSLNNWLKNKNMPKAGK